MDIGRLTLLPVILTQGLWVARRALCLPEPAGPLSGTIGAGPDLRLLIVGDSSALGVGAAHQGEALSGQVAGQLAPDARVHWKVVAKTGATAGDTVRRLNTTPAEFFDVAIVALGVNDSKNAVAASAWASHYSAILDILATRFHVEHTIASGIPPVQDFPILPNPLRHVLSRRARHFDAILRDIIARTPHASYLAPPDRLAPEQMAADGFHAGPPIYAAWGRLAAAEIRARVLCIG